MGGWSGGNSYFVFEKDLTGCGFGVGSQIAWGFETYTIQDRLIITTEPGAFPPAADTLVDTGWQSGFAGGYVAIPLGATRLVATVIPGGEGTAWVFNLGCNV